MRGLEAPARCLAVLPRRPATSRGSDARRARLCAASRVPGRQARLDFAKDEDTTLPRFEFEADVEPFLGLLADGADADPWKVPDGCLVPERLEDGPLELGSAVLHGFIFSDGKAVCKGNVSYMRQFPEMENGLFFGT